ncbi:MMPL family transporter [Micromonospora sp. NPDC048905]|uniref:MMPL family transporter n=1 Tax=Micromonospora sp. NPDC048905 TaxID=3155494 RepID=UPI0033DFAEC2
MFGVLGRAAMRGRWLFLALSLTFVVFSGVWGTGLFGVMHAEGGFDDPASESYRAQERIQQALGRETVDVIALYDGAGRTVDDPSFRAAVDGVIAALPTDLVARTTSYWSTNQDAFVSTDRGATYVAIQLAGDNAADRGEALREIEDDLAAPGLTVQLGGPAAVSRDISAQVAEDILFAEAISIPLLLVLLVLIFRSAVAALVPLLVGGLVILGSFTLLRVLTYWFDVSPFSINIVTMLGLGFAIDYALFIVSRFREELPISRSVGDAIVRTMNTAGRTVFFSGLTIAISLLSLTLFPQVFLRSMGFGGVAAVLLALVGSMTMLPAVLAVVGHRINALRVPLPRRRRSAEASSKDPGRGWYLFVHRVMRRPVLTSIGIVALLLVLGSPFLRVEWGNADERVLPVGSESRTVAEVLDERFPGGPPRLISAAVVRSDGATQSAEQQAVVQDYIGRLDAVSGVDSAQLVATGQGVSRIDLRYALDPQSEQAREMLAALRAVPPPSGTEVLFTGGPAQLVDLLASVGERLPWMGLFVLVTSLVLLFIAFGSVLLPLKSVVMNLLSLSASFGALVLIFQDGNLAGPLAFTPTGMVDVTMPVLMLAIAFGLSMDYEVFLLSRIREQWDRTGDPIESIAVGVQRTAGIITSAALLLVVVVGAFATSGVVFIKMVGVGLVIAIVVDATIVRGLLVPATMRLLGRAAWWLPAPVAGWWDRHGIKEHDSLPDGPGHEPAPAGNGVPGGPGSANAGGGVDVAIDRKS